MWHGERRFPFYHLPIIGSIDKDSCQFSFLDLIRNILIGSIIFHTIVFLESYHVTTLYTTSIGLLSSGLGHHSCVLHGRKLFGLDRLS